MSGSKSGPIGVAAALRAYVAGRDRVWEHGRKLRPIRVRLARAPRRRLRRRIAFGELPARPRFGVSVAEELDFRRGPAAWRDSPLARRVLTRGAVAPPTAGAGVEARLRGALQAAPELLPRGSCVLVAFSGGSDSLALLHLLRALSDSWPLKLRAAHFDHGLQPESAAWAARRGGTLPPGRSAVRRGPRERTHGRPGGVAGGPICVPGRGAATGRGGSRCPRAPAR